MRTEPSTTDKMATLFMVETLKRTNLEELHTKLYDAAHAVLSNWESGDLAEAMRGLQRVVTDIDKEHDAEAAIEAGWDRREGLWVRFASGGEVMDPELDTLKAWMIGGVIYCRHAHDALTQDDFGGLGR